MPGAPDKSGFLALLATAALGVACSSSASKVTDDASGGTTSSGGTSSTGGGSNGGTSGGTTGSGGTTSSGGTTGTGGGTGSGGTGGQNDLCPEGMAYIPGGSFDLAGQAASVEAYCIDLEPVSSGDYAACSTCSPANADDLCNAGLAFRDSDPANCLDMSQAEFYCQTLDKRLPLEEEWEWAARGGMAGNDYPWGDDVPTESDDPHRLCWLPARTDVSWPDRPSGTCPIGFYDQAAVHPFGLEDMSGNVWHWTTSVGTTASNRVVRGGGYDNKDPARMTTSFRNDVIPVGTRHDALGFRCVAAPLE